MDYCTSIHGQLNQRGYKKKRAELLQLLQDAKKKFDALIAKSVSKLGRNTIENLLTAREIENLGIRLILPEEALD